MESSGLFYNTSNSIFFFSLPSYHSTLLESIKQELISVFDQNNTLEMIPMQGNPLGSILYLHIYLHSSALRVPRTLALKECELAN